MENMTSFGDGGLLPQEEKLELIKKEKSLFVGIPKETCLQEGRIPLAPEAVNLLVSHGHEVYIETGAGDKANFSDNHYSEAGAKIVYTPEEVYKADIILKVVPPSLDTLKSKSFINEGVGSSSTPDGKILPGGSAQVIETIRSLVPSD